MTCSRQLLPPPNPPFALARVVFPPTLSDQDYISEEISKLKRNGEVPYRIPSPLLYHRRSLEVLTQSSGSQEHSSTQFSEQELDYHNSRHTRLMSEIRAHQEIKQAFKARETECNNGSRHQLIVHETPYSMDTCKDVDSLSITYASRQEFSNPVVKLPRVSLNATAKNAFIFPNATFCTPESANIKFSLDLERIHEESNACTIPSLISPQLHVPGVIPAIHHSTTQLGNEALMLRQCTRPQSMAAPSYQSSDLLVSESSSMRDRADTKDSLDSQFRVETALRKLILPIDNVPSTQQKFAMWNIVPAPSTKHEHDSLDQNSYAKVVNQILIQNYPTLHGEEDDKMFDWLVEELKLDECFVPTDTEHSAQELYREKRASLARESLVQNTDDRTIYSNESGEPCFDCDRPDVDSVDACSAFVTDPQGSEIDEEEWIWDEDDWKSVLSSSCQQVEG